MCIRDRTNTVLGEFDAKQKRFKHVGVEYSDVLIRKEEEDPEHGEESCPTVRKSLSFPLPSGVVGAGRSVLVVRTFQLKKRQKTKPGKKRKKKGKRNSIKILVN
eukprot:TRINITY_DN9993_c0_g1_i4.p3 TRINITY_DN9993_c0_g1~~TRINITY_DN9993_c0_g1_i4.p3  ORF type:complete len:104 (-),score=23.63 TRINITY_DN9993_c0_g1_i4:479-790(-)